MGRNKYGLISFEMVYWVARVVFLIIVITSVVFLIRVYVKGSTDTEGLEIKIMMNHILYSPNSIIYYDAFSGRPIPGVVDLSRLNDNTLDRAFYFGEKNTMTAAEVEVYDMNNVLKGEAFYNKLYYERWLPLTGAKGPGGVTNESLEIYTLYYSDEKINQGVMRINVLIPKS